MTERALVAAQPTRTRTKKMMKLGYSEFSFGYAFTENLIRSTARPTGAPVFLNTFQEGQRGFDVQIDFPGRPLYFQYKLPELMVRNSAAEITKHSLSGLTIPFFRMYLMRSNLSTQHQKLIELENGSPNAVFYAAPGMKDLDAFNDAYNSAKVHCRSVFFSPKEIGPLPDDKQHVIAYNSALNQAWLPSEPREVAALQCKDIEVLVRLSFEEPRYRTLEAAVRSIREQMLPLVPSRIRAAQEDIWERVRMRRTGLSDHMDIDAATQHVVEEILVYREIARVGLGLDLVIAQPPA